MNESVFMQVTMDAGLRARFHKRRRTSAVRPPRCCKR